MRYFLYNIYKVGSKRKINNYNPLDSDRFFFQVLSKLQVLRDELAEKTKQKKELEDSIELCVLKLERAGKLISKNLVSFLLNSERSLYS